MTLQTPRSVDQVHVGGPDLVDQAIVDHPSDNIEFLEPVAAGALPKAGVLEKHPTGAAAVGVAALVVVAKKLGVDLTLEEGAVLWAAVTGAVSWLTPRL
ncbi:MAG: hypothetical protein PGN13_16405 [Patulibacter minatonensis]